MIFESVFRAMGSEIYCEIDSTHARVRERLERVPAMFEAWEETLSRFRAHSELSQLNTRAGERVRVSETLWRVLKLAQRAEKFSDGIVTPTVLNALEVAGYDRSFETLGDRVGAHAASELLEFPAWDLHEPTHCVTLAPHTRLDLGGVAKGWAAEQTANYLGELGPTMVDAGGDIVMSAPPAQGAWSIGIENPFAPDDDATLPTLRIARGAVATSGRDFRKWIRDGQAAHHLIDPRTGLSAITDVMTATVIAPTIFQAEVAAKVALILGSAEGMNWIQARDELAALLILEDEQVLTSTRMERFLA